MNAARSERAFLGISVLLFAVSAALTVVWCGSMSAMDGIPMLGGWTLSMAWMRMPGQTWGGAAAQFLGMWAMMMVAMMLPSLIPMLRRYRWAIDQAGAAELDRLTALAALGYFAVWVALGAAIFPLGVALAALEMELPTLARATPVAAALVTLTAGALQFTAWKSQRLACCREARASGRLSADAGAAWRHGLRLGLDCGYCCGGFTAILLALGVMDLCAMAIVTVGISAERLAPVGERTARAIGVVTVTAGLGLLVRAA
jgi:predicted metal-binding membrane protein